MSNLSREHKIAFLIYFLALAAYAGASSGRLRRHTDDNHYVYLANGWLHGRLDLGGPPPHSNDWAEVETVWLKDGRVLRGGLVQGTTQAFRTVQGEIEQVPVETVERREKKYYVSFPPFPALVMLPAVAIFGMNTNDVLFNVLIAGLAPALLFLLLRRLRGRGDSSRSEAEDLWLTAALAVGSVFYYSSVIGQVWYTAHVVSVVLIVLYTYTSLDARHPFWAGLCLVCGFLCRPEILFAAPLFLWELYRTQWQSGPRDRARLLRTLILFGAPVVVLGFGAGYLNLLRFGKLTEFGHTFLNVRWTPRIQRFGLFNYAFLGRNLACMLALTPRLLSAKPFVQTSWHGLALWLTSPFLLYLLWPRIKGALHRPLWITTACVAVPDLLYQNSGWVQFGYRFSLDYMVFLVCLLAIGGRPMTRVFKLLIVIGVVVNLYGAITFGQLPQFAYDAYFPPGID